MKHIAQHLVLIMLALFMILVPLTGCERRAEIEYILNSAGTGYILAKYDAGSESEVIVPDTHEGLPVTAIGDEAFAGCEELIRITLPASIQTIGVNAFSDCYSLASINLPAGITDIGQQAFENCSSLAEVIIPAGVTHIRTATFYGCSLLTGVTLHDGITTIDSGAFFDCGSLERIFIPESVIGMGDYAFQHCYSLTILCEAPEQPDGWGKDWNISGCLTAWSCEP